MKRITARHSPPPRPRPAAPEVRDLDIVSVGARGDGLAEPGPIYAPYTLPGERIRAKIVGDRAEMLEILAASPERQAAPCAHFGRCGGCQLQHWGEASYLAWKRQQVVEALAKRGLGGGQVEPVIPAWGEGRRRAAFHAGRVGAQVRVGFIERGGARLTPISQCPALAGPLEALALKLAPLAALVLP
ncbi:MAG: hypothetical protein JNK94_01335, partial [Hyphomonadaceae bacterium]|nr:hypothetical protein [Hyphomonadaceae bacterium]